MARRNNFDPQSIYGKNICRNIDSPNFSRHILDIRINCSHCQALVWADEKTGGTNSNPLFSICCSKGKVTLPEYKGAPDLIKRLLLQENDLGKHFVEKIRAYNSLFAFTSLKANVLIFSII